MTHLDMPYGHSSLLITIWLQPAPLGASSCEQSDKVSASLFETM